MTKPDLQRATRNLISGLTAKQVDLEYVLSAIEAGADANAHGFWYFEPPRGKALLPALALAALAVPHGSNKKIMHELLRSGADAYAATTALIALQTKFREEAQPPKDLDDALLQAVRAVGRTYHVHSTPVRPREPVKAGLD